MATIIETVPQQVDYKLWQGDTWAPGTITAKINNVAIDFTGYSAKLEIRTKVSGDLVKTLTSSGGGITMSSVGVITITMTAAETSAIPAQDYNYDLQITAPSTAITTYTYGNIAIVSDITAN